jgi:hypothetical protein
LHTYVAVISTYSLQIRYQIEMSVNHSEEQKMK